MPKKNLITNLKVFEKALENVAWKLDLTTQLNATKPSISGLDTRHLNDLGPLLIDVSQYPENQREEQYLKELGKMADALYTLDPKTNRPYPEAIKPYMTAFFKTLKTTTDINWNNQKEVENLIATMRAAQAIATFPDDFKQAAFELFPTHEAMAKIDAISGKAYLTYLKTAIDMSRKGLEMPENFGMLVAPLDSCSQELQTEICEDVYDATLKGTNVVLIDPDKNELMKKHFANEEFTALQFHGEAEYTSEEYLTDFASMLSVSYYNTAMEQMIVGKVNSVNTDKHDPSDLLLINGKSIHDIQKEKIQEGMSINEANLEAAKMLRSALTDGKSVVNLMRLTFNSDGQVSFYHQDIRVDLDKLNAADRKKNYSLFRRMMHGLGFWKIPEKYPNNKTRDAQVTINGKTEEHKNALKAAEEKLLNVYNEASAPTSKSKDIFNHIQKLSKANENVANNELDNSKQTEESRQPMPLFELDTKEKNIPHEPKKEIEEPTKKINSPTK